MLIPDGGSDAHAAVVVLGFSAFGRAGNGAERPV
jgi:hypothetical protein